MGENHNLAIGKPKGGLRKIYTWGSTVPDEYSCVLGHRETDKNEYCPRELVLTRKDGSQVKGAWRAADGGSQHSAFLFSSAKTSTQTTSQQHNKLVKDKIPVRTRSADKNQVAMPQTSPGANVSDISEHVQSKEKACSMHIEKQPHINECMHSFLVDWLVEVHLKFTLVPETLYLTVNLIDRYLERKEVSRPRLSGLESHLS